MKGPGPMSFSFASATSFIPVLFDTWGSWDMFWCFLGPTHPISITQGLIPHKYIKITSYRLQVHCFYMWYTQVILAISMVELQMDTDGFMSFAPLTRMPCIPPVPPVHEVEASMAWGCRISRRPWQMWSNDWSWTEVVKWDQLVLLFSSDSNEIPKRLAEERIHSWPHCREGAGNETLEIRDKNTWRATLPSDWCRFERQERVVQYGLKFPKTGLVCLCGTLWALLYLVSITELLTWTSRNVCKWSRRLRRHLSGINNIHWHI